MRWLVRSALRVVIAVSAVSGVTRAIVKSMRFPATAAEAIADQPLVRSWMEMTRDGVNLYKSGQPYAVERFTGIGLGVGWATCGSTTRGAAAVAKR